MPSRRDSMGPSIGTPRLDRRRRPVQTVGTSSLDERGCGLRRMGTPFWEEGHQPRQKGTRSLLWRCPSDALWQEAPGASMCPNRFSATSSFDSASPSYHGWPWSRQLETDPSLSAVRVARLSAGRLRCMRREPQPTGRSFAMRTQRGRPSQTNCFPHGAEGRRRRPPVT